ncbi:MAG: chromatin segregation and condensation protein Rec8/ScpA/Scc1 (kleisin family) [Candidatus Nanohaloarchaea archaeon]|jgi:chromatin segregation and condensation protein Rec8/ScpA/Scc1 (kleisin family)
MDNYDINELAEQPWEDTLEVLTADMDPSSIDIKILAERYREYINELEEFDLEVPARAIRLCAALLRIKTLAMAGEQVDENPQEENPMDFEDEEFLEEEEMMEDDEPDLRTGPDLEMPVKPKPKRRMSLNELKDALDDAMEVKERREERQEMRQELDQQMEIDEKSLDEKINSLFSRLTNLIGSSSEKVKFDQLVENNESEEQLEKFLHVLHLEDDQKVKCIQEDFLDDLHVKPTEQKEEVAN